MSKQSDMQKAIHQYRQVKGHDAVSMLAVAKFAVSELGMKLPTPVGPLEKLARDFSKAARVETRADERTGRRYRVNHAMAVKQGSAQLTLWIDIDGASRKQMHTCTQQRREQMVGDAVQLTIDTDHWNSANPNEEPIQVILDFADDVEERKATDGAAGDAAA